MKIKLFGAVASILAVATIVFFYQKDKKQTGNFKEIHKIKPEMRAEYVKDRMKYEYNMLKDPATGKIPEGIFQQEIALAKTLPVRSSEGGPGGQNLRTLAHNNYFPAGPNNIGGRTRVVAYDVRFGTSNQVLIAGCVSGGIMRSTNGGNNWTLVTPQNDIHSFTAIAQDTRPGFQDTWYAGGGESAGGASEIGAFYLGYGIWKSIDNGATWTKLTLSVTDISGGTLGQGTLEGFDNAFDLVHKIAVNPTNGHVYIAGHRRLIRTTDGGTSFQVVFSGTVAANSSSGQMDVAVSNTGRVFLAVNGANPDAAIRGVWVSSTGNALSYSRIAGGQTLGVDSVANWRANDYENNGDKRILISLAPSNNNIAYVFYDNGLSASGSLPKPEADLYRIDIAGNNFTWSNRSANMPDYPNGNLTGVDPLTVQGGWDMMVKVFPTDPNIVYIGGTNLYRSFDGFATTSSIAWINGYQNLTNAAQYPNGHPDIHDLVFHPVNPLQAICANDGGLQVTQDINSGAGTFIFTPVNWTRLPNYQTLQYYYVAMDPDADRNNFVGGSQDNGVKLREKIQLFSPLMDSNDHRSVIGGDGCAVGLSRISTLTQTQFLYGSTQIGHVYRIPFQNPNATVQIQPNGLTPNPSYPTEPGGEFVTNFRLNPDNTEDLYYVNFNRLFRTTSASSVAAGGWTELTGVSSSVNSANPAGTNIAIRALAFTRGQYNSNHTLYIGSTNGKIFRIDDPRNILPTTPPADITPSGITAGSNIQDIAVNPNDDNEIMAVVSNYNAVSIWRTTNAKSVLPTWVNVEGNLSLPSIRSCVIVAKKDASNTPVMEYYVGTSIGLYSTSNLSGGTTTWQREGGNVLNFAVIQSMAYRPIDNVLVLGTHGNGMYYAFLGTPNVNIITGINTITNDKNFIRSVYPTISSNQFQYQVGNMLGIKKINIQLIDLSGKLLYNRQSIYQSGVVPINNLPAGGYILNIYSEDRRYRHVQKIIKQ